MSIRNLDKLLAPRAIALFGASKTAQSVGQVLAANLFNSHFDGPIMPVNPKHAAIEGVLTYPGAASLPAVPDLAVIATPPDTVPGLIADLGARGTRAAVVISAGFGERGDADGLVLQQAMLDAARPNLLRIVGPNCLGVMVPRIGLDASFAHLAPPPGQLAFVAQSGAMVAAVLDWAAPREIGFSHLVSLGDMADVDFGDMLDYLAVDPGVRAILLYVEAVSHARKFMSAARIAARSKPVIVIKAGRHAEGARAAASHTGALAGADAVYDAAFRRAGMLRVTELTELFDAVETVANLRGRMRWTGGDRLAILTNGGGIGVLATDAQVGRGGRLAALAPETVAALDAALPPTWSRGNPVDIIGDAPGARYGKALDALMRDRGADAVLVLNCPTAVASSEEAAQAVIDTLETRKDLGSRGAKPVLTSWVGEEAAACGRRLFSAAGIPTYDTPNQAVRSFGYMIEFTRSQVLLRETPPSLPEAFETDREAARAPIEAALAAGRDWLTGAEAKAVLAAYAVPVVPTRAAATPEEAGAAAAELLAEADAVALKIASHDITHKSDVGGVVLDLPAAADVVAAARAMLTRVAARLPEAQVDGFTVQPMVRRRGAHELIAGVIEDVQFGPAIMFGQGGTAVELIGDTATTLPPLNMHLAREVIGRTRIARLLAGYRDRPAADVDAIALTLIKLSQLAIENGEVAELDINPLLADADGVVALDARIRVKALAAGAKATDRLAILPYPKELEDTLILPDDRQMALRPVRPEDEPAFQHAFTRLTREAIRMRFFAAKKELSHDMAARMTQIDYDREMALVLCEPDKPAGQAEILGAVHISADPDGERAEYAILVRSDMTGLGLGPLLMKRIIAFARARGLRELWGDVLRENESMLRVCRLFGFTEARDPDDPGVVRVTLALDAAAS